ncbi:Enhancer of polycomb-like protein [Rhynchospora pubera]|uniref:Enhancer of polycomb-like protein n=1 Tax=Rhynchospora pubera TaxID=906938 RepID=A0AAV8GEQ5_9POAL|nr:Enhancer of polycomb-like protein [Rhynchospora pubera]
MSTRPIVRPRPLDINKKIPILKNIKDFEDDDLPTRPRLQFEVEPEVPKAPTKKVNAQEIPTPQFDLVDTYERDYSRTFSQPTSYIRARGARTEIGEFVEYDLDNEDEDWLDEFNTERKSISSEKLEMMLFKLEILDHKARERTGLIIPTFSAPIPVVLKLDSALEAFQNSSIRHSVIQSVYNYWKSKRERWQKPILRRLQPPPPVNDTNPYNVFRPREKAHRLHTRRMQRRENNVLSFERLRLVRRNLDQAKAVIEALIKREEKKREVMDCEVNLQRIQMTYKHEAQLVEDGMALSGFNVSSRYGSSEDDYADSDDTAACRTYPRNSVPVQVPSTISLRAPDVRTSVIPTLRIKKEQFNKHVGANSRPVQNGWINDKERDPDEPVLLFTKPVDADKLAVLGIKRATPDPPTGDSQDASPVFRPHYRMGRGGRIVFDRCNPLSVHPITTIDRGNSPYVLTCNPRPNPDR